MKGLLLEQAVRGQLVPQGAERAPALCSLGEGGWWLCHSEGFCLSEAQSFRFPVVANGHGRAQVQWHEPEVGFGCLPPVVVGPPRSSLA